jgi:hypothetical protein
MGRVKVKGTVTFPFEIEATEEEAKSPGKVQCLIEEQIRRRDGMPYDDEEIERIEIKEAAEKKMPTLP